MRPNAHANLASRLSRTFCGACYDIATNVQPMETCHGYLLAEWCKLDFVGRFQHTVT